jgi:hypothetical protein
MSDDVAEVPGPHTGGVTQDLVDAVAYALAGRRHRVHWAQPGLTITAIQRVLRDQYPDLQTPQVRQALATLGAVETRGKSGEDTGVSFWSLPPAMKVSKCSHCGAEDVEVLTWSQPGAKQTSICTECAG